MGLRLPGRTGRETRRPRLSTPARAAGVVVLALVLAGCSTESEAGRFGMPEVVTTQGESILELWVGAWIAALVTGVVVWGLILYAVFAYRRRRDDEVPVQTRYNLPVEIFYTVFPIVMVIVFFSHTVRVQNEALDMVEDPDVTVHVVGHKWTWTFNYEDAGPNGEYAFVSGSTPGELDAELDEDDIPTLVLPVDQTIEFQLFSPDVIHDFGIPAFAMRMDVVPGNIDNAFQVHTTEEGSFEGKCYELCGTYHSRMLFHVEVVSQEEYDAYLQELASDPERLAEEPVVGGEYADVQVLNDGEGDQE